MNGCVNAHFYGIYGEADIIVFQTIHTQNIPHMIHLQKMFLFFKLIFYIKFVLDDSRNNFLRLL